MRRGYPKLEGRKVLLRKLGLFDIKDLYINIKDKEVSRFHTVSTSSLIHTPVVRSIRRALELMQKMLRVICQQLGLTKIQEEFKLGIVSKDTAKVIGIVSIKHIDRKSQCAAIGIWIGKKYWGQGIMFEAEFLAIDWAFGSLGLRKIRAEAHCENIASIITMKKLGFRIIGTSGMQKDIIGEQVHIIGMEVTCDEFKSASIKE